VSGRGKRTKVMRMMIMVSGRVGFGESCKQQWGVDLYIHDQLCQGKKSKSNEELSQ
jgi:hypothetical protein